MGVEEISHDPLSGIGYREILNNLQDGVYIADTSRRVVFWNDAATRLTGFAREEAMGRLCPEEILGHVDSQGQPMLGEDCLLMAVLADGQPRSADAYIHHLSGHRVPVSLKTAPITDQDGRITGVVEVLTDASMARALREQIDELSRLAYIDPLTSLPNRRYAETQLEGRLHELKRYARSFGVFFADVDFFKAVNDLYGHDKGDEVLAMVASTLTASLRTSDMVARWGGEEFVAVLSQADEQGLRRCAERARALVASSGIPGGPTNHRISVTVSIGATLARPDDTVDSLIARADSLMYESKQAGRDTVTLG
jgi:diguanylate cyclase (GGDEF)-like protein/PAS domain S-box-containing protein